MSFSAGAEAWSSQPRFLNGGMSYKRFLVVPLNVVAIAVADKPVVLT
jgi:hypothetical protein